MYEMEMKAWVKPHDYPALKKRLHQECEYRGFYDKKDRYFSSLSNHSCEKENHEEKIFRIRSLVEEGKAPCFWVTLKEKQSQQEYEINREIEYQVSSEEAFIDFANALGYHEFILKQKKCHLFHKEGFAFELNEIVGLGFFLEIEYLTKEKSVEKTIVSQLKKWLTHFDIPHTQIESEYYFSLLQKKRDEPCC